VSGFTLALAGGVWALVGTLPVNFAWGTAAILAGTLWVGARLRLPGRLPARIWLAGALLLGLLDWGGVDLQAFDGRSPAAVHAEGAAVAAYLAAQPGKFRVYSPSYSLPQQTAARYGLDLADGVDPLQLETYAAFMEQASGVPRTGYSVTVPPFETGDPETANQEYSPDPARLGLLNVRYVVAAYDLPVAGLALRARFGETRVYENQLARPRAWVQLKGAVPGEQAREAAGIVWSPNRIAVTADGPGLLVLSEIAYPGWRAWVDGQERQVQVVSGLLRGVQLEAGPHAVIFAFRPASLYLGIALFLIGCAWMLIHRIVR
jgi:hypothetical protein